MIVQIYVNREAADEDEIEALIWLLEDKIELLAKLYDVDLFMQHVVLWIRRSSTNTTEMWYTPNDNYCEVCLELQLAGPDNLSLAKVLSADAELMDYIAFYAVMTCNPTRKQGDDALITYYTLKYGYKSPPKHSWPELRIKIG